MRYIIIKYIYDNPVKAGICKRPEEYPYSNYKQIPFEMIDNSYTFIDTEESKEKEYLEELKKINRQSDDGIDKMIEMVKLLKDKYNLSFRKIAKILNIGREKARELYKK